LIFIHFFHSSAALNGIRKIIDKIVQLFGRVVVVFTDGERIIVGTFSKPTYRTEPSFDEVLAAIPGIPS